MYEHKILQNLDAYFDKLSSRKSKEVYFYRINGYNEHIKHFIQKYYEAAMTSGVVIEGKIPNPDEKNLSFYEEIMGMNFQFSVGFITSSLKKWLPRMHDTRCNTVAVSIYDTLDVMRKEGKNENILKNAYIKFMCWLYYRFERVVNQLGNENIPKILYEGSISNYELKILSILSNAGCDVILLQYEGDLNYLKLDPESKVSHAYQVADYTKFPREFNLKWIRAEKENRLRKQHLYGEQPQIMNCTNAWIEGTGFHDILKSIHARGNDKNLFYNCFLRMNGVEDKLTYLNELYQFQLQLNNSKRKVVILDDSISQPTMEEIGFIKRRTYINQEQMLSDLSNNIKYAANIELQRLMIKVFIDTVSEEASKPDMNMNKLTNKAVYLLCWLKRYQVDLFANWKMPDISCFIYLGGCKNDNESMFLRFLARLPVDVVILVPNLNTKCCLEDRSLYEMNYINSMAADKFPREDNHVNMGTVAYHAERELDTLMYQDTGMYRNHQYHKANAVVLKTMYEEISILWDQELKYRPNFSTMEAVVNIPVIFAKVSGVKDGLTSQYWSSIKLLNTSDTFIISNAPFIQSTDINPVKAHAFEFIKNGKVQKDRIKKHQIYQYGFLREEMQDHIIDKLQLLIQQKTIKGTFENGTEYTIISTVLNMDKNILRMLQRFDFTKKNPKLIYIITGENIISLEDSILTAFLNLVGFDIVFFVPTGYQCVENFFNKKVMEEHQIGDYIYDLNPPHFESVPSNTRRSWREKIFRRGN